MTEDPRHYQAYFARGQRWGTAQEFDAVLNELGTPRDIIERNAKIEALLEKNERREAVWQFLTRTGAAFVVIVTILGALKALLPAGWPW